MNTTNFETETTPANRSNSKYKNIIIGALAACVVGLGAYTVVDKNKSTEQIQQKDVQIAKVVDEKSDVQNNFDASLARLDSMATVTKGMEGNLTEKNAEIAKVKTEIRSILNKKNATAAELGRAKKLIADLNGKITGMEADIARLTEENKGLNEEKVVLTKDKEKLTQDLVTTTTAKQELDKKVDIASTLNASNIMVKSINVKGNGKEKETTVAKRIDKLLISFDVNNRIAQNGVTDLFVLITGPDGKTMQTAVGGNGTFTTREEGEKSFTAKVPVDMETAKKKNVAFAFVPGPKSFQMGSYKVQIYQNGFLIGEGTTQLKKGGLFS
jgi:predicted  nucleic acid-binding Zn-ribbon protein